MIRQILVPALAAAFLAAGVVVATPALAVDAAESWLPSLITETPAEGFDLAVSMARKAVKTAQPDVDVLHSLRGAYAQNADSLIDVSSVVADYFAIVAEANHYWRD